METGVDLICPIISSIHIRFLLNATEHKQTNVLYLYGSILDTQYALLLHLACAADRGRKRNGNLFSFLFSRFFFLMPNKSDAVVAFAVQRLW